MKKVLSSIAFVALIALVSCSSEAPTGPVEEKTSNDKIMNSLLPPHPPEYKQSYTTDDFPYLKDYNQIVPVSRN